MTKFCFLMVFLAACIDATWFKVKEEILPTKFHHDVCAMQDYHMSKEFETMTPLHAVISPLVKKFHTESYLAPNCKSFYIKKAANQLLEDVFGDYIALLPQVIPFPVKKAANQLFDEVLGADLAFIQQLIPFPTIKVAANQLLDEVLGDDIASIQQFTTYLFGPTSPPKPTLGEYANADQLAEAMMDYAIDILIQQYGTFWVQAFALFVGLFIGFLFVGLFFLVEKKPATKTQGKKKRGNNKQLLLLKNGPKQPRLVPGYSLPPPLGRKNRNWLSKILCNMRGLNDNNYKLISGGYGSQPLVQTTVLLLLPPPLPPKTVRRIKSRALPREIKQLLVVGSKVFLFQHAYCKDQTIPPSIELHFYRGPIRPTNELALDFLTALRRRNGSLDKWKPPLVLTNRRWNIPPMPATMFPKSKPAAPFVPKPIPREDPIRLKAYAYRLRKSPKTIEKAIKDLPSEWPQNVRELAVAPKAWKKQFNIADQKCCDAELFSFKYQLEYFTARVPDSVVFEGVIAMKTSKRGLNRSAKNELIGKIGAQGSLDLVKVRFPKDYPVEDVLRSWVEMLQVAN